MDSKFCAKCSNEYFRKPYMTKNHSGWVRSKFCSRECCYLARKGKKVSPQTQFKKGGHSSRTTEFKVGHSPWNKGLSGWNSGERNSQWKGGVTPENNRMRKSLKYREWRSHVFQRDNWTCQACGIRECELHADHVLPFSLYPDLRFEILNGRTLCVPCHEDTPTYKGKLLTFNAHCLEGF